MNAFTPPSAFDWQRCDPVTGLDAALPSVDLIQRWDAIQSAGAEIGTMAQLAKEPETPQMADFIASIAQLSSDRQTLVHYGIADIEAVLSNGIAALRTIEDSGRDVTALAVTLWCEFYRARKALLALAQEV